LIEYQQQKHRSLDYRIEVLITLPKAFLILEIALRRKLYDKYFNLRGFIFQNETLNRELWIRKVFTCNRGTVDHRCNARGIHSYIIRPSILIESRDTIKNRNEFLCIHHTGDIIGGSIELGLLLQVLADYAVHEERLLVVHQRVISQRLRQHGHGGHEQHRKHQRQTKRDRFQDHRVIDSDRHRQQRGQVHRVVRHLQLPGS